MKVFYNLLRFRCRQCMDIVQNCKARKRRMEYGSKEQTHSGLVQGMCPLVTLWQLHLTEEEVRISGANYHNKS